jgi:hypothetical protein
MSLIFKDSSSPMRHVSSQPGADGPSTSQASTSQIVDDQAAATSLLLTAKRLERPTISGAVAQDGAPAEVFAVVKGEYQHGRVVEQRWSEVVRGFVTAVPGGLPVAELGGRGNPLGAQGWRCCPCGGSCWAVDPLGGEELDEAVRGEVESGETVLDRTSG